MKQGLIQKLKRLLLHSWMDVQDAKRAMPHAARKRLQAQIQKSEKNHLGQIRIGVEGALPLSYVWRNLTSKHRALTLFGKLRIWDTEHNNGVLIYLLLAERKIEIIADRGLSRVVNATVWTSMLCAMQPALKTGQFEEALSLAINQIHDLQVAHFALTRDHINNHANELPDAILVQ